jgi:hypothetical protein
MIKVKVKVMFKPDAVFDAIEHECEAAMEDLMLAAWNYWRDQAEELNTTRRVYREAVQKRLVAPGEMILFLQSEDDRDNFLANALELGYSKFNIWPAVLSGRGSTKSKSAYYYSGISKKPKFQGFKGGAPKTPFVDIPFRPGKTLVPGLSKSKEMGKPAFYRRMSRHNIEGKWIHPGFKARNFAERVAAYIEETAEDVFSGPLKGIKL